MSDMTEVVNTNDEAIVESNEKNAFEGMAKTGRTLRNIKNEVAKTLKDDYGIDDDTKVRALLKTHGLDISQFDFISSAENAINAQILNDTSIDANANKSEKTIESMQMEALNPAKKAIGYDMLYRQMKQDYGKEKAKELSGEMYTYALALADSTNICKPYCYAIDASKIVTEGRKFGQLESKPAKRLGAYISALCETIHQMSNHLAGAIAVGTLFIDSAHLLMYTDNDGAGYTLDQIRSNKHIRKEIENEYQQFVHSVNHLSRNAAESPFSNISIFDRPKLRSLLADQEFVEYFKPDTDDFIKSEKVKLEYVVDYIMELQKIFVDFFDKGDPSSSGMPYRFPIITLNLSKDDNKSILDEEFFDYVTHKDIYRYNIFSSTGTKVASCCRLINDIDLMKEYGSQSNSFGGTGISLGSHRVVTIDFNRIALEADSYKQYFEILDKRIKDAAMILKSHKNLLQLLTDKGLQLFISNGWIRMDRLFSTFGILGLVEAKETIDAKHYADVPADCDIIKDSLVYLDKQVFDISKQYGLMGNIEQIPAESMAVRLAKTDRLLYGEEAVPYKLYANQFVPLWKEASLWDKLEADGKYNKLITGGGIVHAQIGERVTPKQAQKIIRYAIDCGCEHFALNAIYTKCDKGHASFGKQSVCPVCGSHELKHFTRVVGFFTEVENWNPTRRDWEFPRRTFVTLPDDTETVEATNTTGGTDQTDGECESCKLSNEDSTAIANTITKDSALDVFEQFNADNPTILIFYRTNCPHCHEIASVLEMHKDELKNAKSYLVDDNCASNLAIARHYGVAETPSLVVASDYKPDGLYSGASGVIAYFSDDDRIQCSECKISK